MRYLIIVSILFFNSLNLLIAQTPEETARLKKELNLKEIVWDSNNGDGVFLAQSKENKKWGMYQQIETGKRPKKLISMSYDSLGFFGFNGQFTVVKNEGKYGVISTPWSGEGSRQLLRAKYELLKYVNNEGVEMLASKQDGKWGYLNYQNGDTLIPFEFDRFQDLPVPSNKFYKTPLKVYPEKLKMLLQKPDTITVIDLSDCKLPFIPNEIGQCTKAMVANLEENEFSELPDAFFNLKNLETIYIGDNTKFRNYDKRFANLTNLKTLVIGRRYGYRGYTYNSSRYEFSPELKKLSKLQHFELVGTEYNASIPEFIYHLPNLKTLILEPVYLTPLSVDLNKLSCINSLEKLSLGNINQMQNINENIQKLTKLADLSLKILDINDSFSGLQHAKNIHHLEVIGCLNTEGNTYMCYEIINLYGEDKKPLSPEQKNEAIEAWNAFISRQTIKE